MNKVVKAGLAVLFTVAMALAQEARTAPVRAMPDLNQILDQILEKYVEALGGRKAIENINSRIEKGLVELTGEQGSVKGSYESYAKAPNKEMRIVTLAGLGDLKEVFDGSTAWMTSPRGEARERTGIELAKAKIGAEFYKPLKLRNLYSRLTFRGKEKIEGRDAYIVEAVVSGASPDKLYFDEQTGLLVRRDFEMVTPEFSVTMQNRFEDFREVDGIKLPFTIRLVAPDGTLTIRLSEIKHNVQIEDSKFDKPAK